MHPPTYDNYEAKSAFWGTFDPTVTLTLMRSSLLQSPLVVKVWSNSVNKYPRYLANNVCSGLARTDRHTDARTLCKHNASRHYVGGGIKIAKIQKQIME